MMETYGINVKRGFSEIKKALPTYDGKTIKEIFNGMAMILMSKVGRINSNRHLRRRL